MKKFKKIALSVFTVLGLSSAFLLTSDTSNVTVNATTASIGGTRIEDSSGTSVGTGLTDWGDHYFAPFVDWSGYSDDTYSTTYGNLALSTIQEQEGIDYFNLGFIKCVLDDDADDSSLGTNPTTVESYALDSGADVMEWGIGGLEKLSPYESDEWQFNGIIDEIAAVRENGGDIMASIGGAVGWRWWTDDNQYSQLVTRNFFQYTDDETLLENTYLDIVEGFGLTKLDLDIEGDAEVGADETATVQDDDTTAVIHSATRSDLMTYTDMQAQNELNAEAIAAVQEATGVDISLTLPVSYDGLTEDGLATLECYLDAGVEISNVNIMTMCYTDTQLDTWGLTYAEACTSAVEYTMAQVQDLWEEYYDDTLSESDAYGKIGTVISIGTESSAYSDFTEDDAQVMYDFAVENGLKMLSFWDLNRDSLSDDNDYITEEFLFTDVYINYTSDYEEYQASKHTITFDSNGGSDVDSITAVAGTAISVADPTRDGYTFDGWYLDSDLTTAYTISVMPSEDITLYAKWTYSDSDATLYTITLVYTSTDTDSYTAAEGSTISEPDEPTLTGYTFTGWYTDEDLSDLYDFDDEITGDLTLYAGWDVEQFSVTYESNGGTDVDQESVDYGSTFTEPTDPTKSGYLFIGWYTDEDLTELYDFDTEIEDDITLYARWIEVSTEDVDVTDIPGITDLLTEDELESLSSIEISSVYTETSSVSSSVVSSITNKVSSSGTVAYYVNITITAILDTGSEVEFTELSSEVSVTITIESDYRSYSDYGIVRYHDGTATILDTTYDSTSYELTFSSDEFSTYAIYYSTTDDDDTNYAIYIAIGVVAVIAILGGVYLVGKSRKRKA